MKKIIVKTGYGYYRDQQGHIVSKAVLPTGEHPLADDLDYIEVLNEEAIDLINIYADPAEITRQQNEQKIQSEIRQAAIDSLKSKGELPQNYV